MIARLRRSQEEDKGFTLVELLVVIIIIGILSAVAVPVYLNQQRKARDSAANSDVSTIGKEIQAALVDNPTVSTITIDTSTTDNHYTMTVGTDTVDLGRVSDGVTLVNAAGDDVTSVGLLQLVGTDGSAVDRDNWCVAVHHTSGTDGADGIYRYSATEGIQKGGSCSATIASS
jgi:type IV pilus assembly protein PilA